MIKPKQGKMKIDKFKSKEGSRPRYQYKKISMERFPKWRRWRNGVETKFTR